MRILQNSAPIVKGNFRLWPKKARRIAAADPPAASIAAFDILRQTLAIESPMTHWRLAGRGKEGRAPKQTDSSRGFARAGKKLRGAPIKIPDLGLFMFLLQTVGIA